MIDINKERAIGEMRDLDTIRTAITAAETGHLVIATMHTKGAVNTIDRIIDTFPADQQAQIRIQLSAVLRTVVSQQLLTNTGPSAILVEPGSIFCIISKKFLK